MANWNANLGGVTADWADYVNVNLARLLDAARLMPPAERGTQLSLPLGAWSIDPVSKDVLRYDGTEFVRQGSIGGTTNASELESGTLDSDRLPVVPVTKGGTGADTLATAQFNLGIGNADLLVTGQVNKDRLPAVTRDKIADGAVGEAQIGAEQVSAGRIKAPAAAAVEKKYVIRRDSVTGGGDLSFVESDVPDPPDGGSAKKQYVLEVAAGAGGAASWKLLPFWVVTGSVAWSNGPGNARWWWPQYWTPPEPGRYRSYCMGVRANLGGREPSAVYAKYRDARTPLGISVAAGLPRLPNYLDIDLAAGERLQVFGYAVRRATFETIIRRLQ